ncbi:hypothetical protein MANES_09G095050v8 [Manihot esculenta]|uniref:Uncharacterized protein n=1 Tax=Manihot esculenta TaxID=3983 RepID=A0ACB7H593_MANES|nr:hypothetical protein MANES_09G095050v8 [Manihot esculenta]
MFLKRKLSLTMSIPFQQPFYPFHLIKSYHQLVLLHLRISTTEILCSRHHLCPHHPFLLLSSSLPSSFSAFFLSRSSIFVHSKDKNYLRSSSFLPSIFFFVYARST